MPTTEASNKINREKQRSSLFKKSKTQNSPGSEYTYIEKLDVLEVIVQGSTYT